MTELAGFGPDHTALEIGTGSGYQAAILARLTRQVCTVEIVAPLAATAANALRELGYDNVRVRIGDGYQGWPECGPFDTIIVTAALPHVPPPLIEQLKVGGRLVMPVGAAGATQVLTVVEKTAPDQVKARTVALVRFVPFTRPPQLNQGPIARTGLSPSERGCNRVAACAHAIAAAALGGIERLVGALEQFGRIGHFGGRLCGADADGNRDITAARRAPAARPPLLRSRSAAMHASDRSVSGSMSANSSPPIRASDVGGRGFSAHRNGQVG